MPNVELLGRVYKVGEPRTETAVRQRKRRQSKYISSDGIDLPDFLIAMFDSNETRYYTPDLEVLTDSQLADLVSIAYPTHPYIQGKSLDQRQKAIVFWRGLYNNARLREGVVPKIRSQRHLKGEKGVIVTNKKQTRKSGK